MIGDDARRTLLQIARAAIRDAVLADDSLRPALERTPHSAELESRRAVFVTLKSRGEAQDAESLRGCIGHMSPRSPLLETVAEIAPKAALEDPRFPPLDESELNQVRISLSVLSPREALDDPSEIVIGVDGVELVHGERHAVFLPSVAAVQGWDIQQLLRQLSLKAGLTAEAWREATLFRFRGESFGEND